MTANNGNFSKWQRIGMLSRGVIMLISEIITLTDSIAPKRLTRRLWHMQDSAIMFKSQAESRMMAHDKIYDTDVFYGDDPVIVIRLKPGSSNKIVLGAK